MRTKGNGNDSLIYIKTEKLIGGYCGTVLNGKNIRKITLTMLEELEIGEYELVCPTGGYLPIFFQKIQTIILNKLIKKYGEQ